MKPYNRQNKKIKGEQTDGKIREKRQKIQI